VSCGACGCRRVYEGERKYGKRRKECVCVKEEEEEDK